MVKVEKNNGKTIEKKSVAAVEKKHVKQTAKSAVKKTQPVKKNSVKKNVSIQIETKLIDTVVSKLEAGKAVDLISIDLNGRASFADYLVIASGTSSRHVMALVQNLARDLKKEGISARIEGEGGDGNWVVLDLGTIIVHVFNPESRSYYDLEGMWQRK